MLSRLVPAIAVALGASLVFAQTYTSCNPTAQSCPADPALGGTVSVDFTKGPNDFFTISAGTTLSYDPSLGAVFTIDKDTDAPTITSTKYIFYGTVELVARIAPGTGIVTSFVMQSDDLDEIDWEWLGGDDTQVQTNYFSKGCTTDYNRGGFSSVSDPIGTFHTYTIDWTPTALTWSIDGTVVRTLNAADASGCDGYPQTPMMIKLGTWDGGSPTEPQGTVEWAGGLTDFSQAPFSAYYKSITITDSNTGATEYVYGDETGSSGSIQVVKGSGGSSGGSSASVSASASVSTSAHSSAAPSSSGAVKSAVTSSAAATTLSTVVSPVTSGSAVSSSSAPLMTVSMPSGSISAGAAAAISTTSVSSSPAATSAPTTVAKNAAGALVLGRGGIAIAGAALLFGALL